MDISRDSLGEAKSKIQFNCVVEEGPVSPLIMKSACRYLEREPSFRLDEHLKNALQIALLRAEELESRVE